MVRNIFNNSQKKSKYGRRYTAEWVLESMMLLIKSPKAYYHLRGRHLLPLPDPDRIRNMISSMPCSFGFNELSLEKIAQKLVRKQLQDRFVVLMFDEVSLLQKMSMDKRFMLVDGFVDFGLDDDVDNNEPGRPPRMADHALVFLVRSLKYGWIQPIGIFATCGACPAKTLKILIEKATAILEQRQARLIAVISDGHQTNRALWNLCGISGEMGNVSNWMRHPIEDDAKIYFISDVPHLFKCIRNNIWNKKSDSDGVHVCVLHNIDHF